MTPEPQGWYNDPFGRHEARYFSAGKPTKLVRDGGHESNDPPPSESDPAGTLRPAQFHEDDESSPERIFEGQNFERRWGGSTGYDRVREPDENWVDRLIVPSITFLSPSRFQERGYWTRYVPMIAALPWVLLAFGAIIGGVIQLPSTAVPTHRFLPSPAQLDILSRGGTAIAPDCSTANDGDPSVEVTTADADKHFTVYTHSVIAVDTVGNDSAEVSFHAPLCNLDSESSGGVPQFSLPTYSDVDYYAERPGTATIYFIDSDAHVSVVEVTVTSASPPSSLPALIVFILGLCLAACLVVIVANHLHRRRTDTTNSLRRADDDMR